MKLRASSWRSPAKAFLLASVALLGIALTLIVGPLGCALLCSDDCCVDDSSCPICLFAGAHAAPANTTLAIVIYVAPQIALPAIPESEIHFAEDHQLLPGRGPPALLALVAVR